MTAAYHSPERSDCESGATETRQDASDGLQSHSRYRGALGFRDAAAVLAQVYSGAGGPSAGAGGSEGAEG